MKTQTVVFSWFITCTKERISMFCFFLLGKDFSENICIYLFLYSAKDSGSSFYFILFLFFKFGKLQLNFDQ